MTIGKEQNLGKRIFCAKDYVQDGLIAMWDGIENAGWGRHDPNATVWKDLIGNLDLSFSSGVAVESNRIAFDGSSYARLTSNIPDARSIEVVFECGNDKSGALFCAGNGNNAPRMAAILHKTLGLITTTGMNGYLYEEFVPANCQVKTTVSVSDDMEYSTWKSAYKNSVKLTNSGSNYTNGETFVTIGVNGVSSLSYAFTGKIYCIRVYGVPISQEIVSANYVIDKARFKL